MELRFRCLRKALMFVLARFVGAEACDFCDVVDFYIDNQRGVFALRSIGRLR